MAAKTVGLKGCGIAKEGIASAAITPGELIEFGGSNDVQRHSTVGGAARRAFALENDLIGRGIDDNYAADETVRYAVFPPGAEVLALLTSGETATKGQALESAGNGRLQVSSTPVEGSIVGWVLEDQATAGGRVKLEVN
jgi:hypothetical protein